MFYGMHLDVAIGNGRCHGGIGYGRCRHLDVHRQRQINAPEHDARVRLRRAQRDLDALTTVQANANGTGQGFEGSLLQHLLILPGFVENVAWQGWSYIGVGSQ